MVEKPGSFRGFISHGRNMSNILRVFLGLPTIDSLAHVRAAF
jgi:hypothetical protein